MVLQLIVEGKGEMEAGPEIFRRFMHISGRYDFSVAKPIRKPSSQLTTSDGLKRAIELAKLTPDLGAIVIIFDGDLKTFSDQGAEDFFCPKIQCGGLLDAARAAAYGTPVELVVATREFEAWFLASIVSLRGFRGIADDAEPPNNIEEIRGAKERLNDMTNLGYAPSVDQCAFASKFDLGLAFRHTRSFKKLVKVWGDLHSQLGAPLEQWPPVDWEAT